ncbi:MAG: radical SAM protein [Desulfobacterium sp.]|nr:radical SAM protein [Desulfobacterium sp.]
MCKTNLPMEIILEVTNRCNEACVMCHFHGKGAKKIRSLGDMDPRLWQKVLKEIDGCGQEIHLITHGAGEPLIYPHLLDLVEQASKIDNVKVGFMTNVMALKPDVSKKLLEAGIDFMAFSVDGVEKEPHARYRRGSDLDLIESNLAELIRLKNETGRANPALSFNMVGLPEIIHQEKDYVERWFPHASSIMISKYRPVGSRRLFGELPKPAPCPLIARQMVVTWDGRVAICCEDIHCEAVMGDLNKQSIAEIWNGDAFQEVRDLHGKKGPGSYAFCSECDTWAAQHVQNEEVLANGIIRRETPAQFIYSRQ